jgi:hypothetical protein
MKERERSRKSAVSLLSHSTNIVKRKNDPLEEKGSLGNLGIVSVITKLK